MELDNSSDANFNTLNDLIHDLLVKNKGMVQFCPEKRRMIKLEMARELSKTLKMALANVDDIVVEQMIQKFW